MAPPLPVEVALRIAHATDIHWMTPPPLGRLWGKRLLGSANLYLRGRRRHFGPAAQDALVRHLLALEPDLVVISGDLTAQALPEEFATAREALEPVLSTLPTFMVPGNHDAYTRGAYREGRMRGTFGAWMHLGSPPLGRLELPGLTVLGLDPCEPHAGISAAGTLPADQLAALEVALAEATQPVLLVCHYPLVTPEGQPYDRGQHGLLNAREVLSVLASASVRPVGWLCGHVHRAFTGAIPVPGGSIPQFDAGSGGQVVRGERTGTMNTYRIEEGELREVVQYRFDGEGFEAAG